MSLNQPDIGAAFRRSLHDHWRAFLIEGIILVILGIAAIALPPIAGLAVTVVLGWLFLLGGVVGLIATFGQKNAPGFWWALFSAAIAVLAGGVLLAVALLVLGLMALSRPRKPPPSSELTKVLLAAVAKETPWLAIVGAGLASAAKMFLNRNKSPQ